MAAALKTLAQVAGPGHAHDRRARRDERARRVLGRGARSHRAARGAARTSRSSWSWARAHAACTSRAINEGSWDGESAFVETADEAYDLARGLRATGRHGAGEIVELGGSPPPRRSTGRMVRVRALLTAGALSLAFTLFLTPLFIRLFTRLGWGQFIRDDGPKSHHVKRGTPTMGGIIFILGSALRVLHRDTAGRRASRRRRRRCSCSFMMVGLGARRLHRRLPEDPQAAEPRPRRLGEGRRAGGRRHGVRAARAAVPERAGRHARRSTNISFIRDLPLDFMVFGTVVGIILLRRSGSASSRSAPRTA